MSCVCVSCVLLCPTHIVLCYLPCLLSSGFLCVVVFNSYSVVLFVLFVVVLCLVYVCLVYGCVQHILCCVICLACRRPVSCVWLCPTHIVLCYLSCLSSTGVLCMVVSNTYSVVLFVLFVVVLCLVYGGVQHIYCCVICLACRRPVSCVWLC